VVFIDHGRSIKKAKCAQGRRLKRGGIEMTSEPKRISGAAKELCNRLHDCFVTRGCKPKDGWREAQRIIDSQVEEQVDQIIGLCRRLIWSTEVSERKAAAELNHELAINYHQAADVISQIMQHITFSCGRSPPPEPPEASPDNAPAPQREVGGKRGWKFWSRSRLSPVN
jgi:hypothetical protein